MFSMKYLRHLRKLAMLVFISLKECVCHLIGGHKSEKENTKWSEQIMKNRPIIAATTISKSYLLLWTSRGKSNESMEGFK